MTLVVPLRAAKWWPIASTLQAHPPLPPPLTLSRPACADTLAPGLMEEALAVAAEAAVGTVAVDVCRCAPGTVGLAPLVAQPSHFSGHLDLTELWRWVGGGG